MLLQKLEKQSSILNYLLVSSAAEALSNSASTSPNPIATSQHTPQTTQPFTANIEHLQQCTTQCYMLTGTMADDREEGIVDKH